MLDKSKIIMPSDEENTAINAGIKADPEAYKLNNTEFSQLRPASEVHPELVKEYHQSYVAKIRLNLDLSQSVFAKLLGVSTRTLQAWEQCQRKPSGAALSLLKIAEKRPEVLQEVLL